MNSQVEEVRVEFGDEPGERRHWSVAAEILSEVRKYARAHDDLLDLLRRNGLEETNLYRALVRSCEATRPVIDGLQPKINL